MVIVGFGPQGQMVANMLSSPLAQTNNNPRTYIGFDLDHTRVAASRKAGFNVAYGNGARGDVLKAAGEAGTALAFWVCTAWAAQILMQRARAALLAVGECGMWAVRSAWGGLVAECKHSLLRQCTVYPAAYPAAKHV